VPGLGRLLFQAVGNRDLVLVQDLVVLLTSVVLVVNFLVDLSYRLLDPRIRSAR
jgi:peptide/nickel transport system permease protein